MYEVLRLQAAIQSLDPLRADSFFARLPEYTAEHDVHSILAATKALLPEMEAVIQFDVPHAHAAMRDLGMLISALKRYGCEPCYVVPELGPVLLLLGEKLRTVPRDTVLDYAFWNPDEPRRRKYTRTHDEQVLIESVQVALHSLYRAIATFEQVFAVELFSPTFVALCQQVNQHLEGMIAAIVASIKAVSPQVFAHQLRIFWEPIAIGDHLYDGAGAAQLPLCLIDHWLWASDRADDVYREYYDHTVQYIDPELQNLYATTISRPSLVTQICTELSRHDCSTSLQDEAILAVDHLFTTLIKFRQPHKKLAYTTYEERHKIDPHVVGSSGHRPEVLAHILDLTWRARADLKEASSRCFIAMVGASPGR